MAKISRTCKECDTKFEVYPSRASANFCSMKCVYENLKTRETESRKKVACATCGTQVLVENYRLRENNFCRTKCYDEFRTKQIEHRCENCDSTFKVKMSKKTNTRYCSMKCRNEAFKGENSPLFTQQMKICRHCGEEYFMRSGEKGIYCSKICRYESQKHEYAAINIKFYGLPFWHNLRKECFVRDNYKCQRCGAADKLLHAHHIIPRRVKELDVLSNLISLCASCHSIVERETLKNSEVHLNGSSKANE